jgi:hypothetical protein
VHAVGTARPPLHAVTIKSHLMPVLDLREAAREHQPELPELAHLRSAAINTWRGRMINEHGSARVFEVLADQLHAAGVHADEVDACRSFAAEERHHGVLCGAVVQALGGQAIATIDEPLTIPLHEDVSPLEGAARNLLSICCLSETVAVSLVGAERLEMPEGSLHDLLTKIYADECGHANFGWRLLPELLRTDEQLGERLGAYLQVALNHLVEHELAHLPADARWPAEGVQYGLCSGSDARQLFFATVEQVIVPGLEAHGLPAKRAWIDARPTA